MVIARSGTQIPVFEVYHGTVVSVPKRNQIMSDPTSKKYGTKRFYRKAGWGSGWGFRSGVLYACAENRLVKTGDEVSVLGARCAVCLPSLCLVVVLGVERAKAYTIVCVGEGEVR